MEKIAYCNLSYQAFLKPSVYPCEDASLPTSSQAVVYPIHTYLSQTLTAEDSLHMVVLAKQDPDGRYVKNLEYFQEEMYRFLEPTQAKLTMEVIYGEFDEVFCAHELLLQKIAKTFRREAQLICDVTFGSKSYPIVLYSALMFGEKFFQCTIDRILYGQVYFVDNVPTNPQLRDLSGLYYLQNLTHTIQEKDSDRALQVLDILLSN